MCAIIIMYMIDNTNVSKVLGKIVDYPVTYDNSILVREPRQSNRKHLNIDDNNLPFYGYDIWNAYEVSGLTKNGLPVSGVMKIIYPATSEYIVESKSLKLYLNSFNMNRFEQTVGDTITKIEHTVVTDLTRLLETDVKCRFFTTREIINFNGDRQTLYDFDWSSYLTIEDHIDLSEFTFDTFNETPDLLTANFKYTERDLIRLPIQKFHTSLLKSNCRVTRQPDWGDVFIDIISDYEINLVSLAKYIVSFRDECHFHEEICETIYKRLNDVFKPHKLFVKCFYTRRGGIDICPLRYSSKDYEQYNDFIDINVPYLKTPRQ